MRIVVSGHTFVQRENWARWERFAEMYPESSVTLLVPREWREDRFGEERHFRVNEYRKDNFRVIPVGQIRFAGRHFHRTLILKLRSIKPDIYHIIEERYGWWPYQELLYRRLWCPEAIAVGFTTTNIDYSYEKRHQAIKEKAYFHGMDAMVAASKIAASILRKHGFQKPVLVQHENGADERLWHPGRDEGVRKELGLGKFNIGFIGTVREEKGVFDLAEAVCGLATGDWVLVIIGDGPDRKRMEAILARSGNAGRARFLGFVERKNIPKYVRELDVVVLPSRTTPTWAEQFGLVLAESMLSGVPVIGSSSGSIPEVIGDAGLIFPEGDKGKLRDCLNMLQRDESLREELSRKGRKRAFESFSAGAMSRQIHEFFKRLLEERKRCASSC